MAKFNRYLITAALPYANGPVHIGHLAGCYLPADIYVRYLRAKKADVKFVCGTDEHGVPITIKAMKEGVSPQDVVDKYHKIIGDSFAAMGISFDIFARTSAPIHHQTSQDFFLKMYNDGLFEEKESEQFFDPEKEMFLADRYIIGTCPNCGNDKAYGDQCERCGRTLSPDELINPHSALSNAPLVKKKTKHWYMPLQNYEPWLKEYIIDGHKEWKNNVYGQCKSWLDSGLQSRAMTRDSNWGIKVPLPDAEGKVLYVWFDAPIGYISATKELTDNWADYWCKDDTKLVHFIGKDNIVFHCIIFPAMLKAHGGFVLPDNVPANEFLNIEGEKVSTSRNWAVWVNDYIEDFPDQQDVLRYVLCATAPETKDNDFTWKDFQDRNNSELVAVFGNFVNRAMVLMHKLCGGKVPPLHPEFMNDGDTEILKEFGLAKEKIETSLETYRFREALSEVIEFARKGNQYLQKNEPWILASVLEKLKSGEQHAKYPQYEEKDIAFLQGRIDICLHIALQMTANLAIFSHPFLPFTAKKICHMLKVVDRMLDWENAGSDKLVNVGYSLRPPELLFKQVENEQVTAQVEKLHAGLKQAMDAAAAAAPAVEEAPPAPAKPEIQYDDFAKLDLRVGTILQAEKVAKADKLLKLLVDIGTEQRTVVSGIAMHFNPEDIIGKQVTLVANLAPRKMRGIESQGMILMAEDKGKLVFVNPAEAITPGSGVS
ncbi:methionine--tRNA ligase [Chitinophaga ginsengisegetis]|uniref:methionine--tRNA ligase n=1 Tax=Chitinophaga ginsengisegetis TaxID=393003 RepID=UPI000DB92B45|nr:methionine--tRNA ligase [Chitinophaga ginsengisegetis]MDR6565395.1 methionyl-tRNA synthetase [Chitinophaga ginsengisegetis]MDR6645123.1 methionyl-tRNA synthetase [Chitinophaga ginsengisegetis]MDR6652285.1 methionyl-tRNA synthetase [Chitinophaga ginsengisegetis]